MSARSSNSGSLLIAAFIAIGCVLVSAANAAAQVDDVDPMAPQRMALLIGNADYDQNGVYNEETQPRRMKDLVHPCKDDVVLMRRQLIKAGWQEKDVGATLCNLTGAEMKTAIEAFIADYQQRPEGTLAVLYYSGHGAQLGSQGFIFGVDAMINWSGIPISQFPQSSHLLGPAAVNLQTVVFREAAQLDARIAVDSRSSGFVVLLDACRDNPLLKVRVAPGETVSAPNLPDDDRPGLIVGYATRNGAYSIDQYPNSKYSLYTYRLGSLITSNAPIRMVLDDAADSVRKRAQQMQVKPPQSPVAYGQVSSRLCFLRACTPPDITEDEIEEEETPPPEARVLPPPDTAPPVLQPAVGSRTLRFRPDFAQQAPGVILLAQAVQPGVSAQPAPTTQAAQKYTGRLTGSRKAPTVIYDVFRDGPPPEFAQLGPTMAFDVVACEGGSNESYTAARAQLLASLLASKAKALNTPKAVQIDRVRLMTISPEANSMAGYRFADDAFVYDVVDKGPLVDGRSERQWAEWAISAIPGTFKPVRTVGVSTPNTLSLYVCGGVAEESKTTKVFIQMPTKEGQSTDDIRSEGGNLLSALLASDGRLANPLGEGKPPGDAIEVRSNSPVSTELRYYHLEDRNAVFRAAATLEASQGIRPNVKFLAQYSDKTEPGQMEVWLGKGADPNSLSTKAAPKK